MRVMGEVLYLAMCPTDHMVVPTLAVKTAVLCKDANFCKDFQISTGKQMNLIHKQPVRECRDCGANWYTLRQSSAQYLWQTCTHNHVHGWERDELRFSLGEYIIYEGIVTKQHPLTRASATMTSRHRVYSSSQTVSVQTMAIMITCLRVCQY